MYHRHYTTYIQKELDFLKLLVTRFHEQEKVNGLELDVALSKTQEIYEQLLRIKILPETEAAAIAMVEKTMTAPLPPDPSTKEQPPQPQMADVVAPEKVTVEKEGKISKQELIAVREEKKQPQIEEPAKANILAEKISPPSDFQPINETLAQKKQRNDLSSKLQSAPLSSIASGIGLNDKFLYIRELFKGDNILYSNTIRLLDTAESLDDAIDFIDRHFDWDQKNETTQKFMNLVYRKHGS